MTPQAYIAGPFRAEYEQLQENVHKANFAGVAWFRAGWFVYVPHAFGKPAYDAKISEKHAMRACIRQLAMSDILVVLPDWRRSWGTRQEILFATQLGIPIIYLRSVSQKPKRPGSHKPISLFQLYRKLRAARKWRPVTLDD